MRSSLPVLFLGGLLFLTPKAEAQQPAPTPPPAITADQWREDLRFVVNEIRTRHPNPYHHMSREEFDAAVADLDRRIPTLQRNRIIAGMMRIAAMVGDGHTRIDPRKDPAFAFPSLPVKLYWFEDGLFVRAAQPAQAAYLGARVEAIGGVPVAEAITRAAALASGENMMAPRLYVPLFLAMPDLLEALQMADDTRSATLTLSKGGRRWDVKLAAGAVDPVWPPDTDISLITPAGWIDARSAPIPQWLAAPLDYHRLIDLPGRQALYAQLNMVTDRKEQTLTQFGEAIARRAAETNARAIVLDLRLNQGGNGELRHGFIRNLIRAEDADTKLFVLTARGTFSASQFILDDLDRLTDAVFIGEPASSRATGYGDAFRAAMPNSGINMRTSVRYWQAGQDLRDFTPIDVAAPLTFADYAAGRDPALEAALGYKPPASFNDVAVNAVKSGGIPAVLKAADDLLADPVQRYADRERMLVRAPFALQRANQPAAALALAKHAFARFPKNGDLATAVALIAEASGDKAQARAAAEAALAIDRNNRQAATVLRNVSAQAPTNG